MKKISLALLLFVSLPMVSFQALAARTAVVDADGGADLLKSPDKSSEAITHVKKGQKVTASNYPTAGFFKVRMPDGTIGWMRSDILELGPMPDLSQGSTPPPAPEEKSE